MIITEIPVATSYFWEENRLTTYSSWPFNNSDKCNAERMAAAGFYVVEGNGSDLVECFICGKQFSNWEPDSDPWSKHRRFVLICPFVKVQLIRQNKNKWTIKELCYLGTEYMRKVDTDTLKKDLAKLKDDSERLARDDEPFCRLLLSNKNKKYRKRLVSCHERFVNKSFQYYNY